MQLNLGKVRPVYKGVYDNTQTYEFYDWVVHEKQAFIAIQAIPAGRIPTEVDTAYWVIFGGKGVDGVDGEDGLRGEKGDKGDQGIQGLQGVQGEAGPPVAITSSIVLDDATIALSAAGGKALNDKITASSSTGESNSDAIQALTLSINGVSIDVEGLDSRVTANETEINRHTTMLENIGGGKILGEIFTAIVPYSYLPEGAVKPDGSLYTRALFPDVYQALLDNKILSVTISEYEEQLTQFNRCIAFGLDTANQSFRVPLLPDGVSITSALSELEVGQSYKAGLPNIIGGLGRTLGAPYGAIQTTDSSDLATLPSGQGYSFAWKDFDASRSSTIYGNSTTVTTEQVRLPYFVQIANGSVEGSLVDWSAYIDALQGKVNIDLTNLTTAGKEKLVAYRCIYGRNQAPSHDYAIEDTSLGAYGMVSKNSRYVLDNPFGKDVPIIVQAEVFDDDKWGDTNWQFIAGSGGVGVHASVLYGSFVDSIVVQTGSFGLLHTSRQQGNPFLITTGVDSTSKLCRVHVWKIGV